MTAPLERENLSCLQASNKRISSQLAPLHWCHDEIPHSGTALYMEWISAQPPYGNYPALTPVTNQKTHRKKPRKHALHCLCLVSEPTILYFSTNVSLLQP